MQKFLFYNKLLYASTCFEHYVLIIRRSKLYYRASGIVTCRWPSGAQVERGLDQSSLNLRTGRPPTAVTIPDAV